MRRQDAGKLRVSRERSGTSRGRPRDFCPCRHQDSSRFVVARSALGSVYGVPWPHSADHALSWRRNRRIGAIAKVLCAALIPVKDANLVFDSAAGTSAGSPGSPLLKSRRPILQNSSLMMWRPPLWDREFFSNALILRVTVPEGT